MHHRAAEAYRALIEHRQEIALLDSLHRLTSWDRSVNLPRNGFAYRAEQEAYLSGLRHEKATSPKIGEWLGVLQGSDLVRDPDSDAAVNVREIARHYERSVKIPADLVQELTRAKSAGESTWLQARESCDFQIFQAALARLVDLSRQLAAAVGYQSEPYDALIDEYEPEMTAARAHDLLGALCQDLVPLVEAIAGSARRPDTAFLRRSYPVDKQDELSRLVAQTVGFDMRSGRMDTSEHPFTECIAPGDIRLTTAFNANDLRPGLFGTLHEAGHGLYFQGLPPQAFGTPLGTSGYYGLDESSARLWENAVGHRRAFWEHFFPLAQRLFPGSLADVNFEDFLFAINEVQRSFVRIDADEVTYNLHIFLRFNIERKLIAGELQAADVPAAWNEGFQSLLGLQVPDERKGCLQDIHWAWGAFGYFPTYSLGNLYSAQLFATAKSDIEGLEREFAKGDFHPLLEWLQDRVYRLGQRYRSADLIQRITGAPPSHRPLIEQLKEHYGTLYGI